jgi:hypothetical protein
MLSVPTVIVIGAGAGTDIGMPLGSKLSQELADRLNIAFDMSNNMKSGNVELYEWVKRVAKDRNEPANQWRAAARMVAAGIDYTRSIDAYLYTHKSNERVKVCGKLAIAQTILQYEKDSAVFVNAANEWKDKEAVLSSWMPALFHILQDGIVADENLDQFFNNLCIVNFNYDRCIDQFFHKALCDLYQIGHAEAYKVLTTLKIYHPYGSVGALSGQGVRQVEFGATDYGDLIGVSNEIRTFNEKVEERDDLNAMRKRIATADTIIFLGFHFHQQNMELLMPAAKKPWKRNISVYATALGRSASDEHVIANQIAPMFAADGWSLTTRIHRSFDCKNLFKEYGTTLLARK